MRKNIVVFGSGGHSKVICDLIEQLGEYSIYGLIDSFRSAGETVNGYQILGDETILAHIQTEIEGGVVAIGDNWNRGRVVNKIKQQYSNFRFLTFVHPQAIIARNVSFGAGTVVMAGAVVNSGTKVGDHCIVNTRASIDHDCMIGEYVTIAPGATLGGGVRVGKYSAVSLGANVIHNVKIGDHTVVGAGATVLREIGSNLIAFGVPAKAIRTRVESEPYL